MGKRKGAGQAAARPTRPVDLHVGRRMRERRRDLAIGRAQLAKSIGVSQEQVRRYEAGMASIMASRLHQIGLALAVTAAYFFEKMPDKVAADRPPASERPSSPTSRELAAFIESFSRIGRPELRQHLASLVRQVAQLDEAGGTAPVRGGRKEWAGRPLNGPPKAGN